MAEDERADPPGFGTKLIAWLGRFHPSAAHFPIALLVAAAVARLVMIARCRPHWDWAARFCLWFGTLAAVVTAILGWFMGDFHLTDRSPVLTVHRWAGTAVALVAVGLLTMAEKWRKDPGNRRARLLFWIGLFLATLLVIGTGFLGGAMVYGLHHHDWR
jgi:uncharacterized membrane protein